MVYIGLCLFKNYLLLIKKRYNTIKCKMLYKCNILAGMDTKLRLQILVMYFSLVFASLATLSWLMLHGVDMEGAVLSTMLVSPRRCSEVAR